MPPPPSVQLLLERIRRHDGPPVRLMEVCGGQTHSILRHGIDLLVEPRVHLLHGPGCPVCVTPGGYLDQAIALARNPAHILCTFGDLLRVPSATSGDLFSARAAGGDIRVILSPLEALDLAARHPQKTVILLAIGFETTAPAHALAVQLARERRLSNFRILPSLFLLPPVLRSICADPASAPDAFLAAGHVCTISGADAYAPLADELRRPIIITGFTPEEILLGIHHALRLLTAAPPPPRLFNAYPSAVRPEGNPSARRLLARIFTPCDKEWRGLGHLPASGLALRPEYADFDAAPLCPPPLPMPAPPAPSAACPAADVLRGLLLPPACPCFGKTCTPDAPQGAPMVSPEGACAAYYLHRAPPRTP